MKRQSQWMPPPGILLAAALLFTPCRAPAIGPHEVLVLANARETESLAVARAYTRLRNIPSVNLLELDLGDSVQGDYVSMSPEAFTTRIWAPAQAAMRDRGIDGHILAWAYSTHFPFRIDSAPVVSLQGLTFVRNHMPSPADISGGTYASPLFAGPDKPGGQGFGPQSLDSARLLLRGDMPLPSMTLGYTGPRGNTAAEVIAMLERGAASDGTRPDGTVYFVTGDDIRAKTRAWQFGPAAASLRQMGVKAVVTNGFPSEADAILGIMAGAPTVEPAAAGRYLPGAMADHLTSLAAVFDQASQTKLSRWIASGATGSAGAVCEPMSYWTKFPHARFFNHYRMGCTMIESFYQSIRSPLQLMIIGEPLAAPWAQPASLRIASIGDGETLDGPREVDLQIQASPGMHYTRFVYLVDGRPAGEGSRFTLDPASLAPGPHELRAVAYQVGFVRTQVFSTITFIVK
jgi:hypothetical protein